jgi:hypothetical protein
MEEEGRMEPGRFHNEQTLIVIVSISARLRGQPFRENQIVTMVEQFPDVPLYLNRDDILN